MIKYLDELADKRICALAAELYQTTGRAKDLCWKEAFDTVVAELDEADRPTFCNKGVHEWD